MAGGAGRYADQVGIPGHSQCREDGSLREEESSRLCRDFSTFPASVALLLTRSLGASRDWAASVQLLQGAGG